ncbi:helix-turn-helix domain-containing protein [Aureivirga sp. CE67]|uniref:helix-turn-helix domain-containing protein n=1 Tax=Aureivirga sp. CE67 TaxID=1788983 RepID=UPI0018CB942E|nr:helix-turn-helix transcriptional regulator [Aureivirga sp. CE67]
MDNQKLAQNLKSFRAQKGMTQEFLAEESKVSLRTIQRIEKEETSSPTNETLKRLAFALGVTFEELIGNTISEENKSITNTILFLKQQLSKTMDKKEIKIFQNFIHILKALQEKELSDEEETAIESYLNYLELDKIPSFSNELYKKKLSQFKKYLKTKLKFIPKNFYLKIGLSFSVSYIIAFIITKGLDFTFVGIGIIFLVFCLIMEYKTAKNGKDLNYL